MKKQTAVEWLYEQLDDLIQPYPSDWNAMEEILTQAKAMEKEQLLHAFEFPDASIGWNFEKYLNETYNTDTQ